MRAASRITSLPPRRQSRMAAPPSGPRRRAAPGPALGPFRGRPYDSGVSRFYTIDTANEQLGEVREVLERLRDQRRQLIVLRDEAVERLAAVRAARGPAEVGPEGGRGGDDLDEESAGDEELRRIRLRMQGLIDQMQAAVTSLDEWSVALRDIETGLVDFPALTNGRQVWLCWRLGDGAVEWWHEMDAGFAGRRPLIDLGR